MGRSAWESAALAILALAVIAPAHAQTSSTAPSVAALHLPAVPRLHLTWPITPLGFSFNQTEIRGYANGPLQLFRAESLWLRTPAVQLLSVTSAERAFELDCGLTCQPIVKRGIDLEARLPLPALGPRTMDNYAFLRYSAFKTSQTARFTGHLGAGLAGAF